MWVIQSRNSPAVRSKRNRSGMRRSGESVTCYVPAVGAEVGKQARAIVAGAAAAAIARAAVGGTRWVVH
jgi:hypothetical protein